MFVAGDVVVEVGLHVLNGKGLLHAIRFKYSFKFEVVMMDNGTKDQAVVVAGCSVVLGCYSLRSLRSPRPSPLGPPRPPLLSP